MHLKKERNYENIDDALVLYASEQDNQRQIELDKKINESIKSSVFNSLKVTFQASLIAGGVAGLITGCDYLSRSNEYDLCTIKSIEKQEKNKVNSNYIIQYEPTHSYLKSGSIVVSENTISHRKKPLKEQDRIFVYVTKGNVLNYEYDKKMVVVNNSK